MTETPAYVTGHFKLSDTNWKYVKIMYNDFQTNSRMPLSELSKAVGYTQVSL